MEPAEKDDALSSRGGVMIRAYAWIVAGPLSVCVILAWSVASILAVLYLPPLGERGGSFADLAPRDAPAIAAERDSARQFRVPVLSRVAVVQRNASGLPPEVQAQTVRAAVELNVRAAPAPEGLVAAFPLLNDPRLLSRAREQRTTAITYLFFEPTVSGNERRRLAERYAATRLDHPQAAVIGVTGSVPARLAQGDRIADRLRYVEIATVVVIAVIVGLTFGSLLAPLVALLAGGTAYLIASRVLAWLGSRYGIEPPAELEPLTVVLLLGIVTDYAIFYLSGMRERLRAGEGRAEAARGTTVQYTPTIVTAGLMVAAGTGALAVATQHFFRAFGPGLAITVIIGLAISVTLLPALLATMGSVLFWPRRPRGGELRRTADAADRSGNPASSVSRRDRETGICVTIEEVESRRTWREWLRHAATQRAVALATVVACVIVLAIAAVGLRDTRLGLDFVSSLPPGGEVRRAAEAASAGFAAGILSPTEMVVRQASIASRGRELSRLERSIARQPGVAAVVGPREQPVLPSLGIVKSRDGRAARYLIVFDADPLGGVGIERFNDLRRAMPGLLRQAGLHEAEVRYSGDTALAAYSVHRTLIDLIRIAIAVSVIDLILLMVFLRSLLAPLYLLAASVLALAATLGLTTVVFQGVLGGEDLTYYVPFAASVLLVSLGSDYTIFLVGRIWRERRVRPLRSAIETAIPQARHAISIAALALAATFAMLAMVDLGSFRQLAFLLGAGVLIDAFFVRSLLVPALVALFARTRPTHAADT